MTAAKVSHYLVASTVNGVEAYGLCNTRVADITVPPLSLAQCSLCVAGLAQVAMAQVYADKVGITHEQAGKALNLPSLVVATLREEQVA